MAFIACERWNIVGDFLPFGGLFAFHHAVNES